MAKYASSERTREAIITATGELVAERGFDNVSIRAIANRS
ncbi:MAG: TetR family transcriptional regulator, partial [Desulfovibrio sp.]